MTRFFLAAFLSVLALFPFKLLASEAGIPSEVQSVNVNEADAETLSRVLVGVGMSRAQAIIEYREDHGRFYNVEELTSVKGIGPRTIARNLERIRLE